MANSSARAEMVCSRTELSQHQHDDQHMHQAPGRLAGICLRPCRHASFPKTTCMVGSQVLAQPSWLHLTFSPPDSSSICLKRLAGGMASNLAPCRKGSCSCPSRDR